MDGRSFIRLLFFLQCFKIIITHEPYRASHVRATSFETVVKDKALQNHVIEVVHEYSPLDCGFACLQTTDCQSYNIRQEATDLYECELSSSTKTKHPNDFKSASGVTYYGSDTFHGLGCAVANCPNGNCKETKSYPFYQCEDKVNQLDAAFDLTFSSSTTNRTVTGSKSTSSDQFSICFWCKTSHGDAPFVSYKNENPPSVLNLHYVLDTYVQIQINDEYVYNNYFEIPPIHDDKWHHMCTTWNSSNGHVDIYVDGALRSYPEGETYFKDEKIFFNGTFTIGHFKDSWREFTYNGQLSQLNIWNYVLSSNEVKAIAKDCTVSQAAAGNVVNWGRDFTPTQEDSADRRDCSERDISTRTANSDLLFPGENDKYSTFKTMPTLSTVTISWWLKTSWIPTADSQLMAIASFVQTNGEALQKHVLIAIKGTFEIHFEIAGAPSFHKLPPINDNHWHHMVITWENGGGRWQFFLDGVQRSIIDGFQSGHEIPSSDLVLGQNGDKESTTYSSDDDLQGRLSRFNIWNKHLSLGLIVTLAKDPGYDEGNVNSWWNAVQNLQYYVASFQPSTVVSNAGKSNVAFTFTHWTKNNYARIPYDHGAEIRQLTVCTWLDMSYTDEYSPAIISYSSATPNDFYLVFNVFNIEGLVIGVNNDYYDLGTDSALNNKLWRHFCARWNGDLGEANWYLEGSERNSRTDLPKNQPLAADGIWVFTNEQDSHGGGFSGRQSFKKSLAQLNVWNYVLPVQSIKALSYGGTSIEGNMFGWSDVIANYNPGGYYNASSFHLYMPDAVVQYKREIYCTYHSSTTCQYTWGKRFARIGPRKDFHPPGIQWRCYCKDNVGPDKNVNVVSHYYSTKETQLLDIV